MSRAQREPDYDFGPYEDEYRGFEIRDDETGRGPLILVLALGVLLIFAGVVWNTYRQGVRPTQGGLPVIASDDAPYKRSPDERGGVQVAGQDKAYYDSMDGLGDPALQKTAARNPIDIRRRDPVLAGGPSQVPPVEDSEETPSIIFAEADSVVDAEDAPRPPIQIAVATPQPVTEPTLPAVSELSGVSPEAVSRFADNGAYQVQLSALRSEEAARSAWNRLQNTAPDLFMGANLDIQRADLGAKGVFYRLRVGSFADRDAAKGFCTDVKAAGKDCMVVAKVAG
ncbi:MAG: SPOR domain-containing protein [Henriciella sp.]|nr:SPOR domain-containing protein [Hyphomonadaceae bacterium]